MYVFASPLTVEMTAVFFPSEPKALIRIRRDAICGKIRAQDSVDRARVDVVGTEQDPSANLASLIAAQISNGRNCLLVGRGSRVENVTRAFFTLVLHGVEEQAVQFF